MNPQPDIYDVVPYPANAYLDTHPSNLATVAMLHGIDPAPVDRCRILEIGCNTGANLIPMAYSLPGSEFVGFDLAAEPIARGLQRIAALGLTNIRLLQADLLEARELPELAGPFDYIIAHGLYTWIPQPVRDALLSLCREHLAPRGIAFISYAALPGGYIRLLAREVMQFRPGAADDPAEGVHESMRFLEFIANSRPEGDGFRVLMQRELHGMERRGPQVVFHDELASAYQPVSFRDFTTHAAGHGLRYFSEAEFAGPADPCFQAETASTIQQLAGGDPLAQEQMLDFARMRMYRESLLCHADVPFTYDLQPDVLRQLYLTSRAESAAGKTAGARVYTLPVGLRIETQHPLTIAVLEYLIARSPEPASFSELAEQLKAADTSAASELLVLLLRLVISKMIDLHAWKAPVTRQIEGKPLASGLCRHDVLTGTSLVTPLHNVLSMTDPIARQLILLLDGTRDRDALLREMVRALPDVRPEDLANGIGPALEALGRTGVLVSREAPR